MATILVVEDDPNIAEFVKRGLAHHGFEVKVAETGCQGLEIALNATPELVVLDLTLPDTDGIDVCRELRARGNLGIIILTARHLVGDRVRGLEAGADDYLSKPFVFEELLARVRSVLRRCSGWTEGVIKVGDLVIDPAKREVHRDRRPVNLTPREFELLKLLAENSGKPLRRETILQRVWGYGPEGEADPVKVYVNYLRGKLNVNGGPDLIHTLRGFGYVLKEGP
jgi:DNA-binding response OmpR family regulator